MFHALTASPEDELSLLAIGTIAGVLPDADALYYFYKKKALAMGDDFNHHRWISHTFPPYLLLAACLLLLGKIFPIPWLESASYVLAVSSGVHLLLDMVGSGDGIMALWPFSQRMFGIGKLHAHGLTWKRKYEASPYVRIEQALVIGAVIAFSFDLVDFLPR
jgi:membrane-bound metal-dependent hydrolase YbcI (DUF457 family)